MRIAADNQQLHVALGLMRRDGAGLTSKAIEKYYRSKG